MTKYSAALTLEAGIPDKLNHLPCGWVIPLGKTLRILFFFCYKTFPLIVRIVFCLVSALGLRMTYFHSCSRSSEVTDKGNKKWAME